MYVDVYVNGKPSMKLVSTIKRQLVDKTASASVRFCITVREEGSKGFMHTLYLTCEIIIVYSEHKRLSVAANKVIYALLN